MSRPLEEQLASARRTAELVRSVTIGPSPFDPLFPYHGAIRICPFCDASYRRHGGFSDHRDECEEGPLPGANPVAIKEEST